MVSIKQLEAQGRALLDDQKALVADKNRPWSAKRKEYDQRQADIEAVLEQHRALKAVDGRGFDGLGSLGGTSLDYGRTRALKGIHAGLPSQGYQPIPAPQLDLAPSDVKELHEAAMSHKSFAVTGKATDSTNIAPANITDYRLPPVTMRREPTRVLSLLPTFSTEHPTVTWYSTTGTAAAAAVAEGATKPTSTLSYTAQTTAVTKIAHVVEVSDETLADFPSFLGVLQQDMVDGLIKAENAEVLNATVAGASKFPGLLNTTGILTRAKSTETSLDTLEMALDDLRAGSAFAVPDGMVMNPATWGALRRAKDTTGRYYLQPDPTSAHDPNIWGVPIVLSSQIATGTVLVGDFGSSVATYVREGIRVETTNQGTAQFTANTTLVRCEERLLVTVPRPTGLIKVTGIV